MIQIAHAIHKNLNTGFNAGIEVRHNKPLTPQINHLQGFEFLIILTIIIKI